MRGCLLAIVAVIVVAVGFILWARLTVHAVDGIHCDFMEASGYHVHAWLAIEDGGKIYHPPANVGIKSEHLCLYWVHTHDASGIIHIEAPNHFIPTLGNFFDVWGQPLSRSRVGRFPVTAGRSLRVYLNRKPYDGDARTIPLHNHTQIVLEIGPPFRAPPAADFGGL